MSNLPPEAQIVPGKRGVEKTASAIPFDAGRGFHANVSETISVIFEEASVSVPLAVVAGNSYPYAIKAYTAGTQTLVVIY